MAVADTGGAAFADRLGLHLVAEAAVDEDLDVGESATVGLQDDELRVAQSLGAPEEGTGRSTVTAVISCPSTQRVASTSWATESLISMELVKKGGLATLRWRLCSISGRPSCPPATRALRRTYSVS